MKNLIAAAGVAAALSFVAVPAVAQCAAGRCGPATQQKAEAGEQATVTGYVIDVSCKFGQNLSGPDHRMCAQVCADKGIPLAILTTDGKLYIPTTAAMPGESQNPRLKEFAEQKVTVTGKVFPAGGAQAIQIASVKQAS